MWTKIRITAYITSGLLGLASLMHILGIATYDAATGMLDPKPFNVPLVAGIVAPVIASGLASIAAALGWGKK
jgi:hypothetical protein